MSDMLSGFAPVAGTALTVLGAVYAANRGSRSTKEANAVNFTKTLLERVESLEDDVQKLQRDQQETLSLLVVATSFIERLFQWGRDGGRPPEPSIPSQLLDRLDHLRRQDG